MCANWHCDVHAPEYVIELPSELADREGFAPLPAADETTTALLLNIHFLGL